MQAYIIIMFLYSINQVTYISLVLLTIFWTQNQNLYCHLLLIEAENEYKRPQSIMTPLKTN